MMAADQFGDLDPQDRISYSKRAAKALGKVQPQKQRKAIRDAIVALVAHPRPNGCEKLENGQGEYRIRVGEYRVIYEIQDEMIKIQVLNLGPRGDIYKR